MAPLPTARRKKFNVNSRPRSLKRKRDGEDLSSLERRVQDLNPKENDIKSFTDLPLSQPTSSGLEASHFKILTDIQQRAIPLALKGSDVLGAAKTGSGKTLTFLIPVLENLYRKRWTELDGLGALILSPTRELAIQIFEVLRKVGRNHTFSAGLVIGGKSLQEERERLGRMNILVCTPGRILQHMDQTAAFEIDNLQILVLDEADRIMDMGFQATVDAIVEHLPKKRQTMLFSATQTQKVSDLARLSLKDPEYISVHEAASSATPSTLKQHYIVTPLPEKLDTLWSFIRANLKSKILVFLSSGKQVRFVYESFRHMQPGIPLSHLHGRQRQTARLETTEKFSATKNACLFATDVVARGLDFPAVDWVIQLDCPEDADTYIHRVGRTARYERDGRAVLFLEPSEEKAMLDRLEKKKVPIERINVRKNKQQSIKNQLQNMCFKDPELKYLGQKAFVSYVKSIYVQKDKEVFKLTELPLEEFSASMGLPGAPKIKFMKGDDAKTQKNASRQHVSSSENEDDEPRPDRDKTKGKKSTVRTKYDRMFERRNQDVLADHYTKLIDNAEADTVDNTADADEDIGFLTVKRRLTQSLSPSPDGDAESKSTPPMPNKSSKPIFISGLPLIVDSKRKAKLVTSKKKLAKLKERGTKLVFDADGAPHPVYELQDESHFRQQQLLSGDAEGPKEAFLTHERERLQDEDKKDKALVKEKRKEKKERRKRREKEEGLAEEAEDVKLETINEDVEMKGERDSVNGSESGDAKPPRKWFQIGSGDGESVVGKKNKKRFVQKRRAPDELEDLEAVARGLLS